MVGLEIHGNDFEFPGREEFRGSPSGKQEVAGRPIRKEMAQCIELSELGSDKGCILPWYGCGRHKLESEPSTHTSEGHQRCCSLAHILGNNAPISPQLPQSLNNLHLY